MVWFKVDDTLTFHAKAVAAGNAAMGLWVRAGAWSGQQLTEGFIPDHIAASIGTRGEIKRLVDSELWTRVEGGYQFWQWSEDGRQPTKEKVLADREAARTRQRNAREKAKASRDSHAVTDAVTDAVSNSVSHAPVTPAVTVPPTRPDPLTTKDQDLRGDRYETLPAPRASKLPPTPPPGTRPDDARCTQHQGVAEPGRCRGCQAARERLEAAAERHADAARRDHDRRAFNCTACDGVHIVDDQQRPTRRKCEHPETRRTA